MWLKLWALFLGSALIIGCAQKNSSTAASNTSRPATLAVKSDNRSYNSKTGQHLVKKAKSAIGTPYVFGGSTPGGFDCSGLVQWTYKSVGVALPRTAREQSQVGRKIKDVKDMRAGDIVAFRHPKRGYHSGIYIGDGKFVHSPRKRSKVKINSLDDAYFKDIFLGARRVDLSGSENLIAHADGKLEQLVAEKSRMHISAKNLEKIRAAGKKPASHTESVVATAQARKQTPNSKRKSQIAQQARKIKSVEAVTGKKSNNKNVSIHEKLAKASKKSTKSVASSRITPASKKSSRNASKMVSENKKGVKASAAKANAKISAAKKSSKSSSAKAVSEVKKTAKTVSMLTRTSRHNRR